MFRFKRNGQGCDLVRTVSTKHELNSLANQAYDIRHAGCCDGLNQGTLVASCDQRSNGRAR
jgi:hypothetical protein